MEQSYKKNISLHMDSKDISDTLFVIMKNF